MAQINRRRRRKRVLTRLGLASKPGIVILLSLAIIAMGVFGIMQTGLSGGFEVITNNEIAAENLADSVEGASGEVQVETMPDDVYVVHVDGAVARPGVYELVGVDLRIRDAVEAAGGLVEGADTLGVNLAAPVVDGSKVHIPTAEELTAQAQGTGSAQVGTSNTGTALININSATTEQLCSLSGIGEATAANIIADRERNGPFTCIEDLMRVSGIGERKFERVKDRICV